MFSSEPRYTEVNPGADEVLDCQVENIGGECRWQKDGKVSTRRQKACDDFLFKVFSKTTILVYKEAPGPELRVRCRPGMYEDGQAPI